MVKEEKDMLAVLPPKELTKITSNIDDQNKKIIGKIILAFFKENKGIVESVYMHKNGQAGLHYAVVLQRDSMRNRNKILSFFDQYDLSKYSKKYPVYFQFVPTTLINQIHDIEKLNIT